MTEIKIDTEQLMDTLRFLINRDSDDCDKSEMLKHVMPLIDKIKDSDKEIIMDKVRLMRGIDYKTAKLMLETAWEEYGFLTELEFLREKHHLLIGVSSYEREENEEEIMKRILEIEPGDYDAKSYFIRHWSYQDYLWNKENWQKGLDWCNDIINSQQYTVDQKVTTINQKMELCKKLLKDKPDELARTLYNANEMILRLQKDKMDSYSKKRMVYEVIKLSYDLKMWDECLKYIEEYLADFDYTTTNSTMLGELGNILVKKQTIESLSLWSKNK